jgi:hypothetical protein
MKERPPISDDILAEDNVLRDLVGPDDSRSINPLPVLV